jgi:hypothetical protein
MLDNVVEMSMQSFVGTGIPKNVYLDQIISGNVVMFYENLSYCYVIVQLTMVSLDRRAGSATGSGPWIFSFSHPKENSGLRQDLVLFGRL